MLALSIKFILAHIIGDFLLQPNQWVKHKKKYTYKSKYLYWHILVHALALLCTLQFDLTYWKGILIVLISHYSIDLLKSQLENKKNARFLFFIDQILHLSVIFAVVRYYCFYTIDFAFIYQTKSLLLITFILIVTHVISLVIKLLLSKWKIKADTPNEAGKYIGMLERLFVFFFILINYWEGIGFLLAAKSVFRFGDLSKSKDRNLTEYILIGTLLSFAMAIMAAFGYQYLAEIANNSI